VHPREGRQSSFFRRDDGIAGLDQANIRADDMRLLCQKWMEWFLAVRMHKVRMRFAVTKIQYAIVKPSSSRF
jgi:hypothetical protein